MKLSELKIAIKKAEKYLKENHIKYDVDCLVDMDKYGYHTLERLEINHDDDDMIVLNFISDTNI